MKLHHANVLIGKGDCREFVFDILEKELNFKVRGNPDFLLVENESFGILDARNFEKWVLGKAFTGEVKASLITTNSITLEAQNALLKILEEPPKGTHVFIKLLDLSNILPTFLARVVVLDIAKNDWQSGTMDDEPPHQWSRKFFNSEIGERFSIIRSLAKKEDKADMKNLIRDLEEISYKDYSQNKPVDISKAQNMKKILTAKIFASTRGSSPKMLLEWLSCML